MPPPAVGPNDATVLADTPSVPLTPDAPTVVAGRYEILGLLGVGGMGCVYRAVDRELGETIALKMLHRDFVDSDEMVERFRQEVRLARRVTHRNVARTFDIGEHQGEKFLTMELVQGEPLSVRLARELPTTAETIAIARAILAGMSAAHAVGVVHRDLKPDNVLVESGGRVVITDFGIARGTVPGDASKTGGRIVGTPAYMAPEQLGSIAAVDARADVYAFGTILFEMLTGERAWPGSSALSVAAARLVEPPPDPRARRPGLSASLSSVVLRCLARNPLDRYSSAAEVDRALAQAEPSDPVPDRIRPSVPPAEAAERSVAVVPFRNFGPPEDAAFVEGLTEDLIDVLGTVRGLRVRGRGYADATDRDVVETGRRLGVDVVVDGSIRRAGDSLRVSARLVGVEDGFQIWSSRFERPAGAAFALNEEVARALASALSVERAQAPRPQPTDPVAIDLYFRARHAIGRFWTMEGQAEARALFAEALSRAPDDPTILAGYVSSQIGRNFLSPLDTAEATALVRRALARGEKLAEPWIALSALRFNHLDDPAGAVRALKRALLLSPNNGDAHDLTGRILLEADVWEDAIPHLERALWLDLRQRWARVDLMRAAALTGDFTKAHELLASGSGPEWAGHAMVHEARFWSWPGAPRIEGRAPPAGVEPRFWLLAEQFARARAVRDGALQLTAEELLAPMTAMTLSPQSRARRFIDQLMAEMAAIAGFPGTALDRIESAVNRGLLDLAWMSRLRLLDPLRGDPRFQALHGRVLDRATQVAEAWRGDAETLEGALAGLG